MENDRVILVIMDGWGDGPEDDSNAVFMARTPHVDRLKTSYPNCQLITHGKNVGLPDGQMGNSEVGHLNIGAGRVVYQELLRINNSIENGTMNSNTTLLKAFDYAREAEKKVHFMGLVSDGGVHSHINHLKALVELAEKNGITRSYIHAFTDGRDCDPHSGKGFIEELEKFCSTHHTRLASIIGRYYSMDRDKRWERIKKAYDLMVYGKGERVRDPIKALVHSYDDGVTDEFIAPLVLTDELNNAVATIEEGDVLICFNFRTDRCRQIMRVMTQEDLPEHKMEKLALYPVTMTNYDDSFEDIKIIYENDQLALTLGECLEKHGKSQLRMAETEKYPHVTFFFSGGREDPFKLEDRLMVPSPKVATYDLQPEMSAHELTEKCLEKLKIDHPDFVCINYANVDMVGHTGVFQAAVKAAETVDSCVQMVVDQGLKLGYTLLITSDHGNADCMLNPDKSANTAHTKNLVPFIVVNKNKNLQLVPAGILADIAPTVLKLMHIPQPEVMTGRPLVL